MVVLPTTAFKLQMILAGAITTNQLPYVSSYQNYYTNKEESYGAQHGISNSAVAVDIVDAPKQGGEQRILKFLSVYNADTANAVLTVRLNDNATTRNIMTFTLATGEVLLYSEGAGFRVMTTAGAIK